MKKILEIKNVSNKYDQNEVLQNITFDVYEGQSICIVGESGSGKSTLLKCIDGLIKFDGDIIFDNDNINTLLKNDMLSFRSNISLIFQNAKGSLNPNKKVSWIMEEGLKIRGVKKEGNGCERAWLVMV